MELTEEIKNSFLNRPYLDSSETSDAYDYNAWVDFLASLKSDKYNDWNSDLKDVINAGNLKDWWGAGGNDPKGFGATMSYHTSILDEIENGIAEFNHTAPRYLAGIVEVIDIQLSDNKARIVLQLSGVPTNMETDDLEQSYADEIKYRFSIPETAGIGFVDKDDASVIYIDFNSDCLNG